MTNKYILALDQGTTSSRAIVFNKAGDVHRRISCKDCFIMTPLSQMDLNYTNTNLFALRVTWAVDYFDDVFI